MKLNIYVASSWRNELQPAVVKRLREEGWTVYDFMDEEGFSWSSIDPNWRDWTADQYIEALKHPLAKAGFERDIKALEACHVCLLVLPCGRSAHLELGYAVGLGKATIILTRDGEEPELMARMADVVSNDLEEIIVEIKAEYERRRHQVDALTQGLDVEKGFRCSTCGCSAFVRGAAQVDVVTLSSGGLPLQVLSDDPSWVELPRRLFQCAVCGDSPAFPRLVR